MKTITNFLLVLALLMLLPNLSAHNLKQSIESEDRTPAYVSRDVYRHPFETLSFFGIKPDMTVVE
ncbi:uncharacterized protein METZ01_LOCUS462349, partial [marine metagenome]